MKCPPLPEALRQAAGQGAKDIFVLLRSGDPDPCAVLWGKADPLMRAYWLRWAGAPPDCLGYQEYPWFQLPAYVRGQLLTTVTWMTEFFTRHGLK